jgi:energy-coupling factor transport system ATP-binding protein
MYMTQFIHTDVFADCLINNIDRIYMSIKVENLTHIYNKGLAYETKALDDVSFQVEKSECIGIIGHTGSGKSTLMLHLNGLLQGDDGIITIEGYTIHSTSSGKSAKSRKGGNSGRFGKSAKAGASDASGKSSKSGKTQKHAKKGDTSMIELRRRVGLVFQYPEYQLFEETVEKDVAFGPTNLGIPEAEIAGRVRDAIELVGLDFESVRYRSPFELSGGQKRRVAIAGIIAMRPEVLILDEPTAGLDPLSHKNILDMVEQIRKTTGCTVLIVSHNMDDIAAITDKVLVMHRGKLARYGSPTEVYTDREFISKVGLSLPKATQMAYDLQDRGFDIDPTTVLTFDELVAGIHGLIGCAGAQEARNAQGAQMAQDVSNVQNLQDAQRAQVAQDTQFVSNMQTVQHLQSSQGMQIIQSVQGAQDESNVRTAQDMSDVQTMPKAQVMQDASDAQYIQNTQNMQTTQCAQDTSNAQIQDMLNVHPTQNTKIGGVS